MGRGNPVAVPVEPGNLPHWVVPLKWHFDSFCRHGQWTPKELWQDCEEGKRQLWVVWADEPLGAVLTLVNNNTLVVTHAAGRDRKAWLHLWPVLEAYALGLGLERLEAVCRMGWEPELRAFGMRKTHVIMEKRL